MKENKKILIDSVYINSGGGKLILLELIKYLIKLNIIDQFYFLFDNRLKIPYPILLKIKNYTLINGSEIQRTYFYWRKEKKFLSFVCMSNIPPPIFTKKPVNIYFHNDLLINPFKTELNLANKYINYLKKLYIVFLNTKRYTWHIQTELMRKKLLSNLLSKNNKTLISPIFFSDESNSNKKDENTFLYVSNFSLHKNHKRLLNAFINSAKKNNSNIKLSLTLPESVFEASFYCNTNLPRNLKIVNYGVLDTESLHNIYRSHKFLIFPSLNESFGLPLIEAINHECIVLAANLEL